jgi:rhodanese-related sulfurtransferase
MKIITIGVIAFIIVYMTMNSSKGSVPAISSEMGIKLLNSSNHFFLDVRTQPEHDAIAIPRTPVIPIQELANRLDELQHYKDKTIVVYCRSGNRSGTGTVLLNENGYEAVNLLGGMNQWKGPVVKK